MYSIDTAVGRGLIWPTYLSLIMLFLARLMSFGFEPRRKPLSWFCEFEICQQMRRPSTLVLVGGYLTIRKEGRFSRCKCEIQRSFTISSRLLTQAYYLNLLADRPLEESFQGVWRRAILSYSTQEEGESWRKRGIKLSSRLVLLLSILKFCRSKLTQYRRVSLVG